MFNYDCVSFSSSIVYVPYVIILSVSICISSLLVWISINTFKTHKLLSTHRDNDGRILLVNVEINKVEYSICTVYCPNDVSDCTAFLHNVKQFVKCHASSVTNILVGGDFNCSDSAIDKANRSLDKSSKELFDLKSSLSLQDIWRHYHPKKVEYSYIDPSGRSYNSRIDLWLCSKRIIANSNFCVLSQSPAPDHKSVVLEIKAKCNVRGKGYWKLNAITNAITDFLFLFSSDSSNHSL